MINVVVDALAKALEADETGLDPYESRVSPVSEELARPLPESYHSRPSLIDLDPVTVLYVARDLAGKEWWLKDIQAVQDVIDDVLPQDETDFHILSALSTLFLHDKYWTDFDVFNHVTTALAGNVCTFHTLPVLALTEMMTSIDTSEVVLKIQGTRAKFHPDVVTYIAATCLEHDLLVLPPPLDLAQDQLSHLLSIEGYDPPPVGDVLSLTESKKLEDIDVDGDVPERQAVLYVGLERVREQRAARARREIRAYKSAMKKLRTR